MTKNQPSSRRDYTEASPSGFSVTSGESGGFLSMSETRMLLSMVDGQSLLSSGDEDETAGDSTSMESSTGNESQISTGEHSDGSTDLRKSKKDMMRALLAEYGLDGDLSLDGDSNSQVEAANTNQTEQTSQNDLPQDSGSSFEVASDDDNIIHEHDEESQKVGPVTPASSRQTLDKPHSSLSNQETEATKSPSSQDSIGDIKSFQESSSVTEYASDKSDEDNTPMKIVPLAPISLRQTPKKTGDSPSHDEQDFPLHVSQQSEAESNHEVASVESEKKVKRKIPQQVPAKPVSNRSAYETDPFASPMSTESSDFHVEKLTSQMELVEAWMDASESTEEIYDDTSIQSEKNRQTLAPNTAKRKAQPSQQSDEKGVNNTALGVSLSIKEGQMDKNDTDALANAHSNVSKSSVSHTPHAMDEPRPRMATQSNSNTKGKAEKVEAPSKRWKIKVPTQKKAAVSIPPKRNPSKGRKSKKTKSLNSSRKNDQTVIRSQQEQSEMNDDSSVESPLQETALDESLEEPIEIADAPEISDSESSDHSPILLIKPRKHSQPEKNRVDSRPKNLVMPAKEPPAKVEVPKSQRYVENARTSEPAEYSKTLEANESEFSDESPKRSVKQSKSVNEQDTKKKPTKATKKKVKKGIKKNEHEEPKVSPISFDSKIEEFDTFVPLNDKSSLAVENAKTMTGKKGKKSKLKAEGVTYQTKSQGGAQSNMINSDSNQWPQYELTFERSTEHPTIRDVQNASMRSIDSDGIWHPPKHMSMLDGSAGDLKSLDGSRGSLGSVEMDFKSVEWNGLNARLGRKGQNRVDGDRSLSRPRTPDITTQRDYDRRTSPSVDNHSSAVQLHALTLSGSRSEVARNDYQTTPRGKRGIGRFMKWPTSNNRKELTRRPSTSSFDGGSIRSRSSVCTDDMELAKTPKAAKSSIFSWPTTPRFPSTVALDKHALKQDTESTFQRDEAVSSPPPLIIARSLPESHPLLQSPDQVIARPKNPTYQMTPTPKKPKSSSWLPWAKKSPKDIAPPITLEAKQTTFMENKTDLKSSRPLTAPPLGLSSGRPRPSGQVSQSVAEQREARRQQCILDQQRREAIKIQAAMRGYIVKKKNFLPRRPISSQYSVTKGEGSFKQKKVLDQVNGTSYDYVTSTIPKRANQTSSSTDIKDVTVATQSTKKTEYVQPSIPLRSRKENQEGPRTVAQQREERRRAYVHDQQRRGSIVIQSALRGFIVRKKLGLDKHNRKERDSSYEKGLVKVHSSAKLVERRKSEIRREASYRPQATEDRNKFLPEQATPKPSIKWLPWTKKKDVPALSLSGEMRPYPNEANNIQRFDASLYMRKRMYQDEQENQGKTLAEIKEARRQMYLRDLERREAIKIQSAVRGHLTRKTIFPQKKARQENKRKIKTSKMDGGTKRNEDVKNNRLSTSLPDSFDRTSYLRDRLQRDEETRQTKTVAEVREERQQIYLRDLQRREASRIQAVMRGYITRKRYPRIARKRCQINKQANSASSSKNLESIASKRTAEQVIHDNSKSSGNWGLVKRLLFGKLQETPNAKDLVVEKVAIDDFEPEYEPFDPYADTDDFFGFEDPAYKERNGFFTLEKSERTSVEVQAVSEDARNWKGRKKRGSNFGLDKSAYLKERRAREEYERQSMTMAQRNETKRAAAKKDSERRGAVTIQALARGYITRRLHPRATNERIKPVPKSNKTTSHIKTKAQLTEQNKAAPLTAAKSKRDLVAIGGKPLPQEKHSIPAVKETQNIVIIPKQAKTISSGKSTEKNIPFQENLHKVTSGTGSSRVKDLNAKTTKKKPKVSQKTKVRSTECRKEEKEVVLESKCLSEEYIVEEVIEEGEYYEEVILPAAPPSTLTRALTNSLESELGVTTPRAEAILAAAPPSTLAPALTNSLARELRVTTRRAEAHTNINSSETPVKRMAPVILADHSNETQKHSAGDNSTRKHVEQSPGHFGSTYSTGVGDSWWLPSVSIEDTRAYRQDVFIPDVAENKYYRHAPKNSTTMYWEAVRASYLPSGLDRDSLPESSKLVPPVARYLNANATQKSERRDKNTLVDNVDSWLPPGDDGLNRLSIPHGSADEMEEESVESWVPVPIKAQARSTRVDFAGIAQKEESFRWAPHLPSPSKRDKLRVEQLIVGDINDTLSGSHGQGISDVEQGTTDVSSKRTRRSSCCSSRRATVLVVATFLLLAGGVTAAYFLWEDPPWEKWLK